MQLERTPSGGCTWQFGAREALGSGGASPRRPESKRAAAQAEAGEREGGYDDGSPGLGPQLRGFLGELETVVIWRSLARPLVAPQVSARSPPSSARLDALRKNKNMFGPGSIKSGSNSVEFVPS